MRGAVASDALAVLVRAGVDFDLVAVFHEDGHADLEARADQPEIASRITPDAGTAMRPETGPVVAAVKKLITKE